MMLIKKSVLCCFYLIGYAVSAVIVAVGMSNIFWHMINGKALFGLSTALIMAWIGIGGIMVFSANFKNCVREKRESGAK